MGVVYFHGMGSQRHYEDLSEILDRLDGAALARGRRDASGLTLTRRQVRVERARGESGDRLGSDVVSIQTSASGRGARTWMRFYEAYWAPETVAGTRAPSVAWWLLRQTRKPLQLLLAPWRSYRRLRRGTLVALFARKRDAGAGDLAKIRKDVEHLVAWYEEFQAPEAWNQYPQGTFREFEEFLRTRAASGDVLRLAREWRADHDRREWLHLGAILTLLAGAFGMLGALVLLVARGLASLQAHPPAWLPSTLRPELEPTLPLVATVVALALSTFGITKFLEDFVGDVQQYVSYEETDRLYQRRKAVLESGMRQLRHVLLDPLCKRVVVVAHSLGTAVAVDSLLGLWRYNRAALASGVAQEPVALEKISHLLTYGSPIDKINYFFAVGRSDSATYEDLVESLRGDIGTQPFSKTGRPQIHWINFWDKGDVISGPIETLAGRRFGEQEVDNVRIASHVLPDLGGSHGAYLHHPRVIEDLLRITALDAFDFTHGPTDGVHRATRLGPGRGSAAQTVAFFFVYVLPWALFGTFVQMLLHRRWGVQYVLVAAVLVQAIAVLAHRVGAHRARRRAERRTETATG